MKPTLTTGEEKRWSVFVDGAEVNDFLMTFEDADDLAEEYVMDNYQDIILYQYDTGEEVRVI